MAGSAHGGSPKGGPPHDGSLHPPRDEPTRVTRRGLGLLVWPVAMCWLGLQALGRAGIWLLTGVDAGTSAVARAAGAATRALLRALGPVGRALRRLSAPLLRGLRRAWAWLGRRVFLAMARSLGRFGRWLVQLCRPAAQAVLAWTGRVTAPMLRRLETAAAVVERTAARLGARLHRAAVRVGRRLRPAVASIADGVRALRAQWQRVMSRR
jgi:hypothetical protein